MTRFVTHSVLKTAELDFPDLMTAYVNRYSRTELINLFYERLRYIDTFPELSDRAKRFHRRIAQIPFFGEIITTNWDDYFEREASALPLVTGHDFDYWDLPPRKVLKIHGSILNPGSVVATRAEYRASLRALRTGALGAATKNLLATRSVVFVGYSMRDKDIRDVITVLRKDLGTAARQCYFVHPSDEFEAPMKGADVLRTSAASFAEQLDDALVEAGYLLPTTIYDRLDAFNHRFREARRRSDARLPLGKFPLAIYNYSFQDGIDHALGRIRATRSTGVDRRHGTLAARASGYVEAIKRASRQHKYWDVAYMEGYVVGLLVGAGMEIPLMQFPTYYSSGLGPVSSFAAVSKAIRGGCDTHPSAYRWAAKRVSRLPTGMIASHTPFLPQY